MLVSLGWISLLASVSLPHSHALPIVDPGVFIIQGIMSCHNGTGYCMLGNDCTADIDFMSTDPKQHCDGLLEAFTPSVPFTCCQFNERGKASSVAPTTVISDFTITGDDLLLQEIPILEHQDTNEIPEGVDPSSLIDIIGVVTDMTGVLGLITQPYTRPMDSTGATIITTTTPASLPDGIPMQSNSSHASISLVGLFGQMQATTVKPTTTTTQSPSTTTDSQESTTTYSINRDNSETELSQTTSSFLSQATSHSLEVTTPNGITATTVPSVYTPTAGNTISTEGVTASLSSNTVSHKTYIFR